MTFGPKLANGHASLVVMASGGKGLALNEKPNWQKDLGEPALSPDGAEEVLKRLGARHISSTTEASVPREAR